MSEICPVCDGAGKICTCDDPDGCQKYYDLCGCEGCDEFLICWFCGGTGDVSVAKADQHRVQMSKVW